MDINLPYFELRRKILFEYLEKFKDTPSKTLGRILTRDHPEFFKSEEYSRSIVRQYRGKLGTAMRGAVKRNQFYQNA